MNAPHNPEIARSVRTGAFHSNVHDLGTAKPGQPPVLFIHGSGPGVSAWANWRLAMPVIAEDRRVIAPDMVGFGYSDRPAGITYNMDTWVQQALDEAHWDQTRAASALQIPPRVLLARIIIIRHRRFS